MTAASSAPIPVYVFNASFSGLPARNRAALDALIVISSPVWGLRPLPPARAETTKTPKPVTRTSSPLLSDSVISSNTPSTAFCASILESPVRSASFWTRSFLFTGVLLWRDSPAQSKIKAGFQAPSKHVRRKNTLAGEKPARVSSILVENALMGDHGVLDAVFRPSGGRGLFRLFPDDRNRRPDEGDLQHLLHI